MKQLIDIGDPRAPSGSEPWCRAFLQTLSRLKREGEFAVKNLKYSLREFRDEKHFKRLADDAGHSFQTWEDFVQYKEPYGLGMPFDVAEAVIDEPDDSRLLRDVLGKHGGDRRSKAIKDQGYNITLKERGTSRAYILARLERDGDKELAAMVRAKKLSAKAASIKAGWGEETDIYKQVIRLIERKFSKKHRHQLWLKLKEEFD